MSAAPVTRSSAEETKPWWQPLRVFYLRNMNLCLGLVGVLLLVAAWEIVGTRELINPVFTSSPSRIVRQAIRLFAEGTIWKHLRVSGVEFGIGYLVAMLIGVPLGILTGWYRAMYGLLNPLFMSLYATPIVALIPLIIIWLGVGLWSKVAMVFVAAFFPILISTQAALKALDEHIMTAAVSYGATSFQIFRTVVLPSSVPFILSGLRLGVGRGLIGVFVGEMYAAQAGLGFMITEAGNVFDTDTLFVGTIVFAASGVSLMGLLQMIERKVDVWRSDFQR